MARSNDLLTWTVTDARQPLNRTGTPRGGHGVGSGQLCTVGAPRSNHEDWASEAAQLHSWTDG